MKLIVTGIWYYPGDAKRVRKRETVSKGFTFFSLWSISIMMGFGGLISGGSGGGGVARVVADIAPHSSNKTSGAFAQLLSLLSTPPIGLIPSSWMRSSSTLTFSTVCLTLFSTFKGYYPPHPTINATWK